MTLQAIAHGWRMDCTFYIGGILVRVASEAQRIWRSRDQLDVGCISGVPDLMAGRAAHADRRMDELALGLVFMAGNASGSVRLRVQRDRMFRSEGAAHKREHHKETAQGAWPASCPGI